jgi:hypothetical protein
MSPAVLAGKIWLKTLISLNKEDLAKSKFLSQLFLILPNQDFNSINRISCLNQLRLQSLNKNYFISVIIFITVRLSDKLWPVIFKYDDHKC